MLEKCREKELADDSQLLVDSRLKGSELLLKASAYFSDCLLDLASILSLRFMNLLDCLGNGFYIAVKGENVKSKLVCIVKVQQYIETYIK